MRLDFNPAQQKFVLTAQRDPKGPGLQFYRVEHGLDFHPKASTPEMWTFSTPTDYAAVNFFKHATPRAREMLAPMAAQIEASMAPSANRHIACPYDKELWPFQKADLDYGLARKNWLCGDQPGLGKTPIAICYANEIQAERILVIVPASIRLQWMARIQEWQTGSRRNMIYGIESKRRGTHPFAKWTVVSYDLAASPEIGGLLAEMQFDLIIMDEAHYLKTGDTRRARAIFGGGRKELFAPLASRAERMLALTGTPLPNRPVEAYTLAKAICWDAIDWMGEDEFGQRFNPISHGTVKTKEGETKHFVDERIGRTGELWARMRANYMARHMKRDVLTQLKLPVYDLIQAEETGPVKQALAAESLLEIDVENLEGADITTLGHIAEARRLMGIAIAPQVADYVEMCLLGGEEKMVVFAHHKDVLNLLEQRFRAYGVVRVDGSTSQRAKAERVHTFRTSPDCQIILGNLLSLGTGTDGLQDVCWHAIIAEPDWVPGNNIQAFDRLDRGGQRNTVQGDIFVAPNSLAEKVLASSLRKLRDITNSLDRQFA